MTPQEAIDYCNVLISRMEYRENGYLNADQNAHARSQHETEQKKVQQVIDVIVSLSNRDKIANSYEYTMRFNNPIYIQKTYSGGRNSGEKWAIYNCGFCLSKDGEWEYEPMPSSRDEDFLLRCRYASREEAERALAAKLQEEDKLEALRKGSANEASGVIGE